MDATELSISSICTLLTALGLLVYTLYGAIWRLFLSPIAQIPGPRFAALTFWNEFYYDVVLGGKYTWKILAYHEKYGMNRKVLLLQRVKTSGAQTVKGPVIRINPYEVHINDPEFYDELYLGSSKAKTDKWFWSVS